MQTPPPERRAGGFNLSPRVIVIGLILLVGLYLLTRNPASDQSAGQIPAAQNDFPAQSAQVPLGRIFSALGLDRDGCPVDLTNEFLADDAIYIAAEQSDIPQGTAIFARLYYGDRALEDTDEIIAPGDLNACVNFFFENQRGFEAGDYEAEFYINGSPAGSVAFTVR